MYRQISNFGNQQLSSTNDPLTYCLQDTMDVPFQHGSTASKQYGPSSKKCQLYMAQRCADKWDGFCEYFYQEHGRKGNQLRPNMGQSSSALSVPLMTTGDQLLQNTAERKYCTFGNECTRSQEPFDPMVPNSPQLFYYDNTNCTPVCRVDPRTIDQDPVMNRILVNPQIAGNTIVNICNTSRREGTNLNGTRLGKLCNNYLEKIKMFN